MAKGKSNKGLKSIPNYVKNVTKSAMYAGGDFISDVMPATKSFVDTNTNVFKSIANDMRNFRGITRQVSRQMAQSEMYDSAKKYKNNLIEDLKSGKLYNNSRKEQYNIEASGFGDLFDMSDFDSGFDMNFDNEDSDGLDFTVSKGDILTAGTIERTSNSIVNMTANVGNVIAETSVKSAEMITSNQQNIYTMNTINNYRMFTEINNVLGDMATNIRGLFAYTNNTTEFYNSTLKLNEDMSNKLSEMAALNKEYTEMERNLYKEYSNSKQSGYSINKTENLFDAYGGLNFSNYFEQIGKNIKEQWEGSMYGSSMKMFGDSSNPLLALAGSPLEFIPKMLIGKITSKGLKDSMKNLDKTLSGFFKSGLLKFSSMAKQKGEENPIFDYLYKIFGVEVGQTTGLKTDKFIKGPVPLDGIMRQSIIEVIPGYLRVIAAAVSGNNQKVYNYETGKFEDINDTIKRRDNVVKGAYAKVDETGNRVKSVMDESFMFSEELDKVIKKDTDKFFRFLADKGFFFNPRQTDYAKMNEAGLYLDNEQSFDIINGILKSMGPNSWQELNQQIIESVEYSKNYFEDINKKLSETGLSAVENKLYDLNNTSLKPVDKFNKGTIDYVRDIRSILLEGIRVFVSGSSNSSNYRDIENKRNSIYNDNIPKSKVKRGNLLKNSPELAAKQNKLYISDITDIESDPTKLNKYIGDKYTKMLESENNNAKAGLLDLNKVTGKPNTPFGNLKTATSNILSAPGKIFTNILDSVNNNLITFLYGSDGDEKDKVSLFESINNRVNDMINKTSLWLNDKVIEPLNKALFDPTNGTITKMNKSFNKLKVRLFGEFGDGKSSNGLFSPVINSVLDAKDYVVNGIIGREFTSRTTGSKISKNDKTVLGEFKNMVSSIKSVFVKDGNGDNEPTLIDTLNESVQYKLGSISKAMFGTYSDKLSPTQFYNLNIKDRMSRIGLGSISGLALSMFTPLGLFGGTLMGGAMGALSTSDRFKNKMFGKLGADGERTGGVIPKQYLDTVKKSLPNVYKGIGIGALSSMITPFGFLGSAVLGGGIGFASSTEKVKGLLFGKMGDDGTRDEATALLSKELRDKLKIKLPGMAKGAGLGLVGSFFLPGGPITGSILGLSAGIASQSDTVKTLLFGEIDPATEKRNGGLFGRFKLWFKSDIMLPVKSMVDEFRAKGLYWVKKSIVNPLLDSLAPLKKQAEIMKDNLIENIKAGFSATKDFVGGVFENHVGKPFGKLIEEKFINPLKSFFKNTFGKLGKAFLDVLAAPFAGINKVAMGYKDQHIKMGKADYLDEWNEKKRARDQKTEDDYMNSKRKIKGDKRRISLIQKLMEAGKFDINHPATLKAISMMNDDTSIFKQKVTNNPIKDNLSNITDKSSDIANNTSKMEGSLEYIKNILSNTFNRFLHVKDNVKDVKIKKPKDNLNTVNITNSDSLENPNNAKTYKNENTPTILLRVYDKLDALSSTKLKKAKSSANIKTPTSRIKRESDGIFDVSDDEGESGSTINRNNSKIGSINKPKSLAYNINNISINTKDIYGEIKGQLNNVGYNTELIANILTEQFGAPSMMPKGIRRGIHSLKSKLSSPFKFIGQLMQAPFKVLGGLIKPVTTVVGEVIKSITAIPKAILGTINELAKGAISMVSTAFKTIPAIVNVISTALVETTKVVGSIGVEVVKGVGTAVRATGEALAHLGVGIVKITTEAIPLAFKAINTVVKTGFELGKGLFNIGKNILAGPFKAMFKGFNRRNSREKMNVTEIQNIKNLEFIKLIDNINCINTIKNIENISDPKLYSVLNDILNASKGTENVNVGDDNTANNIFSSIKSAGDNIVNSVKSNLDNITNKNKSSIAKFNAKEKADADDLTQKKLNKALMEGAKADKGTYDILKDVMDSKKGLFGKLFTIFQLVYNGLKGLKSKLFSLGDNILKSLTNGKLFEPLLDKLKNPLASTGKKIAGEVVEETAEAAIKKGAIDMTATNLAKGGVHAGLNNKLKGVLKTSGKNVTKNTATSTALALVSDTGKNAAFNSIDNIGANAISKYGAENIVNATFKVADDVITDSSIITKIFSSNVMKKLCGSKIGQALPRIGKAIADRLTKAGGAKIFAKIGAKWATVIGTGVASGGIIPAIWYGGTVLNGISATNRMFEVSPKFKPTMLMRLIAGVAAFISENITFGIIPDKWICQLIAGFVLSDDEMSRISEGKQGLVAEHEKYMAETGTEITFGDYNKKVANRSLMTKTLDGVKGIGNFITGNAFNNDRVREIQGLGVNDPITFGDRLGTFGASSLSALTLGIVKPEEINETFGIISKVTGDYLGKAKDFFLTLDDKFLDAMDTTNAAIGAIFNLTDEEGNPINFTKWTKLKFDNMGKAIGEAASNAKKKANEIWGSISDKYNIFKSNTNKGMEAIDKSLGVVFGLTNEDGSVIKVTDWLQNKTRLGMEAISDKMKSAMDSIKDVWDNITNIYDNLKSKVKEGAKTLDKNVGSFFNLTNSNGESTSVTGWISDKWNNLKTRTLDRKTRGGRGSTGLTNTSSDNLNGAAYFSQYDSRWADTMYLPTETIKQAGCGPTSAAMVISSVTGQTVTPPEIAEYSVAHGHMHPDLGTSWSLFPDLGQKYGIGLNQTNDFDAAATALSQGRPVIFSGQGPAPFTSGGHFVVGVGMTSDGKVIVNDPISQGRSKPYDYNTLTSSSAAAWISNKSLTGGVISSNNGSNNTENNESSTDITNPFTTALGQIGTLTAGLVTSAYSNEVFNPDEYLFPEKNNSTVSAGSMAGFNGTPTDMDFDFSSLTPIGTSSKNNSVYGRDAIRSTPGGNQAFISALAPQAIRSQEEFGIPASTVMAQAILESGWGKSTIGNNVFGIKEGSGYQGPVVSTKTSEYSGGSAVSITDTFRGYNSISEAVYDHAKNVIAGNPQYYSGVITKDWRQSIQGLSPYYATDPNYTNLLESVIKSNDLTQYNNMSTADLGGRGIGPTPITKSANMVKPLNIQKHIAESLRIDNEKINNVISAKSISDKYDNLIPYDMIINLLQSISDNTAVTAQNTREIADKDFNVNVESTNRENNVQQDNINDTTPPPRKGSGFNDIINRNSNSRVNNAYEKAKEFATGLRN